MKSIDEVVEELYDGLVSPESSITLASSGSHNRTIVSQQCPQFESIHQTASKQVIVGGEGGGDHRSTTTNGLMSKLAFNCNVDQRMVNVWDEVCKWAYDKGVESYNIMRAYGPGMGDSILYYQHRSVQAKPLIWRSERIRFPPRAATKLDAAIISGVAIIDSQLDGMAGEATIIDGGIGCTFVDIKLASKWFKGYSFTIIVMGTYLTTDYHANPVPKPDHFVIDE